MSSFSLCSSLSLGSFLLLEIVLQFLAIFWNSSLTPQRNLPPTPPPRWGLENAFGQGAGHWVAGFLGPCPGSEVGVSVLPGQVFLRFKAGGQIQPLLLHSFKPHVVSSRRACLCREEIFAEGCVARGSELAG